MKLISSSLLYEQEKFEDIYQYQRGVIRSHKSKEGQKRDRTNNDLQNITKH